MKLFLYTTSLTNRISYISNLIFRELMGLDLVYVLDRQSFLAQKACKINYSNEILEGTMLSIPQHALLQESTIQPQNIQIFEALELPAFFKIETVQTADLSFDLLAMVFYLVSRYEEYLDFSEDEHGRFPAKESLAFKAGFLEEPLVDQWVMRLKSLLKNKYPSIEFSKRNYQFIASYDIDFAWSYKYKGMFRGIAAYARDLIQLKGANLWKRFKVQIGRSSDPYFVFDYLDDLHQKQRINPHYFFLLGDYGRFDKSNQFTTKAFQQLIRDTAQKYVVGIHPSYASNGDQPCLEKEINRLQSVTQQQVKKSRQHFLKLRFPQTYQSLLNQGIEADYSMGYAAQPGFRASIAQAFFWYDLSKEVTTNLKVHPFQLMDVSLKVYQKMDAEEALNYVRPLIDKTRAVEGCFVSLWHNSSLTEIEGWQGWRSVYEQIVDYAKV